MADRLDSRTRIELACGAVADALPNNVGEDHRGKIATALADLCLIVAEETAATVERRIRDGRLRRIG